MMSRERNDGNELVLSVAADMSPARLYSAGNRLGVSDNRLRLEIARVQKAKEWEYLVEICKLKFPQAVDIYSILAASSGTKS